MGYEIVFGTIDWLHVIKNLSHDCKTETHSSLG